MNTHAHTDSWIHYTMIVLGFIVIASAVGAVTMAVILDQPVSELLITLGLVATAGLVRLLVPILLIR